MPLPVILRPGFIIRRKAMREGVFGSSVLWTVAAVVVFGRGPLKKIFGRQPERLGTRTIGVGHIVTLAVTTPMTRKERKRSGLTKASLAAAARAELEAAQRAS